MMSAITVNGKYYSKEDLFEQKSKLLSSSIPFMSDFWQFVLEWFNDEEFVVAHTSGSTGIPKEVMLLKRHMVNSAITTCDALDLKEGDTALLCLSTSYIAGKMMVVRSIVRGLRLDIVEPCGLPSIDSDYAFSAMVPMQVYNLVNNSSGCQAIERIDKLIIGGGAVTSELEVLVQPLSTRCYSTYGMTETVSHVALRLLNGEKHQSFYTSVQGVTIGIDDRGCLVIHAPLICNEDVVTNDIAEIYSDGSFSVLGRWDNIINSGGVKVLPEVVEAKLSGLISGNYAIASISDSKFGETIVLVLEGEAEADLRYIDILTRYERPKRIINVDKIPTAANGKVERAKLRKMLDEMR